MLNNMEPQSQHAAPTARERILDTAYDLFSRRGIRDVGIDELVSRSQVAKATLYRHFPAKDDLVRAFLDERARRWTYGMVRAGARSGGESPEDQLLAIFETFDSWFNAPDFDACSFINVLVEMGSSHPLGQASIRHLADIRTIVRGLAEQCGFERPDEFAHSWHILMKGSIIAAAEGDRSAARRAKAMARLLMAEHRPRDSAATSAPGVGAGT
jgi:AcrR family transcriptional regulator